MLASHVVTRNGSEPDDVLGSCRKNNLKYGDELNIVEDPRLKRAACNALQVQVHAVSSNPK